MTTRYGNAATVSDEHGKGTEVLRQQLYSLHTGTPSSHPIMVAEVDMLIRNLFVVSNNEAPTAGTVQFRARPAGGAGTTEVSLTAAADISSLGGWATLDVPLTAARDAVKKGWVVYVTVSGLTPNTARPSVGVGWMPDLWGPSADAKTY